MGGGNGDWSCGVCLKGREYSVRVRCIRYLYCTGVGGALQDNFFFLAFAVS